MPILKYIQGDITKPIEDKWVIAHVVNDIGVMGSGVARALFTRWPIVRHNYLIWSGSVYENIQNKFQLGNIQEVIVDTFYFQKKQNIIVNMIAQHSTIAHGEKIPIRYDALEQCLNKTYDVCLKYNVNLHIPKIGSGLARGNWQTIEEIIKKTMKVDTFCYEYKQN